MQIKYIVLIIGSLLFLISAIPTGLIVFEFVSENVVSNKYKISSLNFNEQGEVGEYEENNIENIYQIENSPPYPKTENVFVTHKFIKSNGETVITKTYGDFISEMKNNENKFYERTYHFNSKEVAIKENLKNVMDTVLTIDDKVINRLPIIVNEEFLLNSRYKNIGLAMKTDNKLNNDELIVVEQTDSNLWVVQIISKSGDITEDSFSLDTLRKEPYMVKVVKESGAHNGALGYKTQMTQGYTTFLYPFIFPFGVFLFSVFIIVYSLVALRNK